MAREKIELYVLLTSLWRNFYAEEHTNISTNRKLFKFVLLLCVVRPGNQSSVIKALKKKTTFAYIFNQMHHFMNSFEALLSVHFLSKSHNII